VQQSFWVIIPYFGRYERSGGKDVNARQKKKRRKKLEYRRRLECRRWLEELKAYLHWLSEPPFTPPPSILVNNTPPGVLLIITEPDLKTVRKCYKLSCDSYLVNYQGVNDDK
jgi:hypothetical protein